MTTPNDNPNALAPGHNPAGLLNSQVPPGHRLLYPAEVGQKFRYCPPIPEIKRWTGERFSDDCWIGYGNDDTYCTTLTRAELREKRGLPRKKPTKEDASFWVIESGPVSRPLYLAAKSKDHYWTLNILNAVRFGSKGEAESCAQKHVAKLVDQLFKYRIAAHSHDLPPEDTRNAIRQAVINEFNLPHDEAAPTQDAPVMMRDMTLLDWFAGQVIVGLMSCENVSSDNQVVAKYSYDIAESIIAERNRRAGK